MILDFSFILVIATVVTGVIWGIDAAFFKSTRVAQAQARGTAPENVREPIIVEYARSFFPVILVVLVIRSFLFEPFRIPSDSMMPTLLDGDFIFVNKYAYGLKLPVLNTKILSIGQPKRGDVIVFRKPTDPATNYIKRLVGLPGDHIRVKDRQVYVNDQPMKVTLGGEYHERGYADTRIGEEDLTGVKHNILYISSRDSRDFDDVVPAGHYFFMGDNRDNSQDSRYPDVGFVPEGNLVGKAVLIWLNWEWPQGERPKAPIWDRIGDSIR